MVALLLVAAPVAAAGAERVTVEPGDMEGWVFFNDNGRGGSGKMVFGPTGQPYGDGSAQITLTAGVDGWALATANHNGTRISSITSLDYSTYTHNTNAISLQLAVNNPSAALPGYHRLVFEPSNNGTVTPNVWQRWNPTAPGARWWITRNTTTFCTQASPCTWTQINAMSSTSAITGGVWLKAGSGWSANTYNVDGFHFAASSPRSNVLYDFEPSDDSEDDNGD